MRDSSSKSHPLLLLLLTISLLCCLCFTSCISLSLPEEGTELLEDNKTNNNNVSEFVNSSSSVLRSKEDSFADMIDRALEKEFTENEQIGGETDAGSFNNSVAEQQVFTGYLLAGSLIGPGDFSFVSEMVQLCGGKPSEGIFVGVLLSSLQQLCFLKYVVEAHLSHLASFTGFEVFDGKKEYVNISALHGQVTVGTLILQDCVVGLLFALLPILGGTSGVLQGVISTTKLLVLLLTFLAILSILFRTCVHCFLKLMISLSVQTNELYQLAAVAFCLLVAWDCLELGSFAGGVMISTTDLAQHTLIQVEPIRNFLPLFSLQA